MLFAQNFRMSSLLTHPPTRSVFVFRRCNDGAEAAREPTRKLLSGAIFPGLKVNAILQARKSLYLCGKLVLWSRILIYESLVSGFRFLSSATTLSSRPSSACG